MGTYTLSELRNNLGTAVREVAYTGTEVIITDKGKDVAVIISMTDYERLHEHADVAEALRLRAIRSKSFATMSLAEMLDKLGVSASELG